MQHTSGANNEEKKNYSTHVSIPEPESHTKNPERERCVQRSDRSRFVELAAGHAFCFVRRRYACYDANDDEDYHIFTSAWRKHS